MEPGYRPRRGHPFDITVQSTAKVSMHDAASYTALKESGKRLRTRLRNPVHLHQCTDAEKTLQKCHIVPRVGLPGEPSRRRLSLRISL
jgi:hypothetical protein